MKVFADLKTSSADWLQHTNGCVLTVGNFDGVHLGHQKLIRQTVETAKALQKPAVALTFSPHPASFFSKVATPQAVSCDRLFDEDDRVQQMANLGLDAFIIQPFDQPFSSLSALQFLDLLQRATQFSHFVVGDDFRFGHKKQGDTSFLRQLAEKKQFKLDLCEDFLFGGEKISTSRIKKTLQNTGDLAEVLPQLGRNFSLRGWVIAGDQRGQKIGFPTANLKPTVGFAPAFGVYKTRTQVRSENFSSITNVGKTPTFLSAVVKIETHIFDFSDSLYDQWIEVEFLTFLRPEKKFESLEALQNQIRSDIIKAQL